MFLTPKKISQGFIIGCGRIIDIGASLKKTPVPGKSDLECIADDWKIIGNDLNDIISAFNEQDNI